jgi:hypothetical protein
LLITGAPRNVQVLAEMPFGVHTDLGQDLR